VSGVPGDASGVKLEDVGGERGHETDERIDPLDMLLVSEGGGEGGA